MQKKLYTYLRNSFTSIFISADQFLACLFLIFTLVDFFFFSFFLQVRILTVGFFSLLDYLPLLFDFCIFLKWLYNFSFALPSKMFALFLIILAFDHFFLIAFPTIFFVIPFHISYSWSISLHPYLCFCMYFKSCSFPGAISVFISRNYFENNSLFC